MQTSGKNLNDKNIELLINYLENRLDPQQRQAVETLLENDAALKKLLAELQPLPDVLKRRERPEPPADFLQQYQQRMKGSFSAPQSRTSFLDWLSQPFAGLRFPAFGRISLGIAALVGGLFIARILMPVAAPPVDLRQSPDMAGILYPMEQNDIRLLKPFFQKSEILLVSVEDIAGAMFAGNNANIEPDVAELRLLKQLADRLLNDVYLVQEKVIDLNDMQMLRLVNQLEMILYEVANLDEDLETSIRSGQNQSPIALVSRTIQKFSLIRHLQELQEVFTASEPEHAI